MDEESHVRRVTGRAPKLVERLIAPAPRIGVAAGVQLHRRDAEILGGVQRGRVRIHEEADPDAGLVEPADGLAQPAAGALEIEAALGSDLLPLLGDQGGLVGTEATGERHDLGAGRQLHVEHPHRRSHPLQIMILDVAAVLPKVRRDAVGAGRLAEERSLQRIGFVGAAGLPHRGHVVHVDVQPHRRRHCPGFRRGLTSLANICQVRHL